jgi:3-oxoacyl-[acyl-carrier protein] reductase
MKRLQGRRCVITGASRGLGAAVAARFSRDGADLLLVSRDKDRLSRVKGALEAGSGQHAHTVAVDLADPEAPRQIVEEAVTLLGGIDVLVNCAGIQGPIGLAVDNEWREWERTIRVNLLSVVDLTRRIVPLLPSPGGKIVTISGGGATAPRPRFTAYATAKAGIVRFCESLAKELEPSGIDVNCVAPGAMYSDMTSSIASAGRERAGTKEYESSLKLKESSAGVKERAAELCSLLASAESDGITGRLISAVWDPWEQLLQHRRELEGSDVYTLRRIVPRDRGMTWGEP